MFRLLPLLQNKIPYVKELRKATGSVTSSILMMQLDYWFQLEVKGKYPFYEGFYKFMEPCDHAYYKEGDSWREELEFSPKEFRNAFDQIAIRHKSKTQFMQAYKQNKHFYSEKGEEKFYCSYYDKALNVTFYLRNHKKTDDLLRSLVERDFEPDPKGNLPELTKGNLPELTKGNLPELTKGNLPIYTEPTIRTYNQNSPPTPPPGEERDFQEKEPGGVNPSLVKNLQPQSAQLRQSEEEKSFVDKENPSSGEVIPPPRAQVEIESLGIEQDPFLIGRIENKLKGTYKSKAGDSWMATQNNVNPEFAQWRYKAFYEPQDKSLADAKAEIRNDCIKARDLWEEYQTQIQERDRRQREAGLLRRGQEDGEIGSGGDRGNEEFSNTSSPLRPSAPPPLSPSAPQSQFYSPPPRKRIKWLVHLKTWTQDELDNYEYGMTEEQQDFLAEKYLENLERKVA